MNSHTIRDIIMRTVLTVIISGVFFVPTLVADNVFNSVPRTEISILGNNYASQTNIYSTHCVDEQVSSSVGSYFSNPFTRRVGFPIGLGSYTAYSFGASERCTEKDLVLNHKLFRVLNLVILTGPPTVIFILVFKKLKRQ